MKKIRNQKGKAVGQVSLALCMGIKMILIIGGAFQGQNEYIKEQFGYEEEEILSGGTAELQQMYTGKAIAGFHLFVKRMIEKGKEEEHIKTMVEQLLEHNSEIVIGLDEIGYGIVPMEKQDRIYRETTGRIGCLLAEKAEQVIRMLCGIPVKIKG